LSRIHDVFQTFFLFFHLRTICRFWGEGRASSTNWLLVADLLRDEELLHGHVVHGGEVLLHQLLAVLPLSTTQTEVLLKVDPELSNHNWVLQVRLNPLKALNTFLTSVLSGLASSRCLANVKSSIDEVVLDNRKLKVAK